MRANFKRIARTGQRGFSTIAIAFVMLALSLPMVMIAESVLVAGRQATSTALGQENLRAVDAAMVFGIREVRLDPASIDGGCQQAAGVKTLVRNEPLRGGPVASAPTLEVTVVCSVVGAQPADGRLLTFTASIPGGKELGKARVYLIDEVGAATEPGAEMLICDWRLGVDSAPLTDC